MTDDWTPKYGLTRSTAKPVMLACWDLSLATLTLETHHGLEESVFEDAYQGFEAQIAGLSDNPVADNIRASGEGLAAIAERLREARGALVAELTAMRVAIEDVTEEEKDLRASGHVLLADAPDPMQSAPVPIGGWSDLNPMQALRVLQQTVVWSREISYSQAAAALGPCYLLSKVIEHPKPQAMGLRDVAGEAADHLRTFLHSAYGS